MAVAEVVGLWLADGWHNSSSEIVFTNNCVELVKHFKKVMEHFINGRGASPRIYIYSRHKDSFVVNFPDVKVRWYVDSRATKPYYMYRIASRGLLKEWKAVVKEYKERPERYLDILRGFFAGEGNINFNKKCNSRVVRIAQGKPNYFLECMLRHLKIKYRFSERGRAYEISGRAYLERLATLRIADLYPSKNQKFVEMLKTYKQVHYPKNFLIDNVYLSLRQAKTTKELSALFDRSFGRIQDVVIALKKQGKIENFRVGSKDYWIRKDKNQIIISKRKEKILRWLQVPKRTSEIASLLNICWKAAYRRMHELEKRRLVVCKNLYWCRTSPKKEVMAF